MSCQTSNIISRTLPSITLPFPPTIKASDIVDSRKPSRVKSKSPNAFLIYRKAFLEQLALSKYNLRMTEVSKLVSKHWKDEEEYVKDEYRKIAQQVEIGLNEKRQKTFTYKVVWKNSKSSKYSALKRKRNQLKTQDNKSAKSKSIVYQFVPAEFNFKPSSTKHKHDKDIISTSDSKNSCTSPKNSQTSSESDFNEFNEFINYQGSNYNDNLGFDQMCLQFTENSTNLNNNNQHFIFDEHVDWYLRNFDFVYLN